MRPILSAAIMTTLGLALWTGQLPIPAGPTSTAATDASEGGPRDTPVGTPLAVWRAVALGIGPPPPAARRVVRLGVSEEATGGGGAAFLRAVAGAARAVMNDRNVSGDGPLVLLDPFGRIANWGSDLSTVVDSGVFVRRVVIGGERTLLAPAEACALMSTPFRSAPPYVELPWLVTIDVVEFWATWLARMVAAKSPAICRSVSLEACLALSFNGRDMHTLTIAEAIAVVSRPDRPRCVGCVEDEYPYAPMPLKHLHTTDVVMPLSRKRQSMGLRNVAAVMYIPTVLSYHLVRDYVRCFHADVGQGRLPLHFVLGARSEDWTRSLLDDEEISKRLAVENATHGDLVLFDVSDSEKLGQRQPSATTLKVLLSVAHALVYYNFSVFVRGADDAYHNFYKILAQAAVVGRKTEVLGHVNGRIMSSTSEYIVHNPDVADTRRRKNLIVSEYPVGLGFALPSNVAEFLMESHEVIPMFPWREEDVVLGLVLVPYATLVDDRRFHDFFNGTRRRLPPRVPAVFELCHRDDWIVHKFPWGALRHVDRHLVMHGHIDEVGDGHRCGATFAAKVAQLPKRPVASLVALLPHPEGVWRDSSSMAMGARSRARKSICKLSSLKALLGYQYSRMLSSRAFKAPRREGVHSNES